MHPLFDYYVVQLILRRVLRQDKKLILSFLQQTVVSSFLSLASTQSHIKANIDVDKKRNVLKCIGLDVDSLSPENILSEYSNRINEFIIDLNGNNVESVDFSDLQMTENKLNGESLFLYEENSYLPVYQSTNPEAIIIPISGKGLWSTLFGYFALDSDFNTVKGITFYKHKETPGLGGEVDKSWFQNSFIGKKIKDLNGNLVSVM